MRRFRYLAAKFFENPVDNIWYAVNYFADDIHMAARAVGIA